eukprot:6293188-Prymnesium_polylepis.1
MVNITFESSCSGRAVVDGQVRIEPLSQVRPHDAYQRRLALKAAIDARQQQQRQAARDAADCAAREQHLRTTLLELQQAVEIATQELAENERALASHCEASVTLSEEIEALQRKHERLSPADVEAEVLVEGEEQEAGGEAEGSVEREAVVAGA